MDDYYEMEPPHIWHSGLNEGDVYDTEGEPITLRCIPIDIEKCIVPSLPVINDYICKGCHNERCSKNEKSCWKCGLEIIP